MPNPTTSKSNDLHQHERASPEAVERAMGHAAKVSLLAMAEEVSRSEGGFSRYALVGLIEGLALAITREEAHVTALTDQLAVEQKRRQDIDFAFVTCANDKAALTAQLEAERAARTCNGNLQVQDATAFLEEASRYFENRPTHGEDRAHWSNVHNAENCRKVISTLTREKARADKAEAEAKALREALKEVLSWHDYTDDMHKPVEVRAAYMRARATLAQSRSDSECDLPADDGATP